MTRLGGLHDLGATAFGRTWSGAGSDWSVLRSAADWIQTNGDIRLLTSRVGVPRAQADAADRLRGQADALGNELDAIASQLRLDMGAAFGAEAFARLPIDGIVRHLGRWRTSGESLFQWTAYRDRAERASSLGCNDVVSRLADGRLATGGALSAFEMAYYEAIYADQIRVDSELGTFDGTLHGRLAREFADMDRQRISSASFEVVRAHHERVPARDGGAVGPLGVLRAEIARKRGHMPIRKLMEKAAPAVQALKPVFMMSPLSVAQFLSPGVFEFDLLVMDEASQIQPVDALGAVARAKQVVVVGDPKQLPPTAFFSKMTGASEEDDEGGTRVADIESILGLFTARGLPMRMLRWHYRSKHQSLIAVSNRQFYENKLFIVPSPYTAEAGMGLRFHRIPQGDVRRRRNADEPGRGQGRRAGDRRARSRASRSCRWASRRSPPRSGAPILDQLEVLRRGLPPETEGFFQTHPAEPFFVKNLENVQGDERDVIFISVGYGPERAKAVQVPMRFGPLGSEGGERRLNVLISRAKQRCEVFASITDEDIDLTSRATRKGVLAFKLFLHFARTGRDDHGPREHGPRFRQRLRGAGSPSPAGAGLPGPPPGRHLAGF